MQIKSCVNSLPTPLCSRTLLPNLASSILSGWHQRREIVVGDVDSVCAPAAGAGQMAALCARFQSRNISLGRVVPVVLYCARFSIHKVSPGWKACAGRCAPRHRAQGTPARQTGHGMPAHCVTADASGYHSSYYIQATTLYCREM